MREHGGTLLPRRVGGRTPKAWDGKGGTAYRPLTPLRTSPVSHHKVPRPPHQGVAIRILQTGEQRLGARGSGERRPRAGVEQGWSDQHRRGLTEAWMPHSPVWDSGLGLGGGSWGSAFSKLMLMGGKG